MADVMHGLVSEAKKNRFSSIPKLTEEDIVSVWNNVSQIIERQMGLQKGVTIQGLGTFTFSQKKLDVGNNKFILIQRPVFVLSEKFAMTHGLNHTKHYITGQIPVVQLNFAALANETQFDRDTVESCVKEVLQALNRSVQFKRNVEFHFSGIGKLLIRDNKVKMKFYKDFLKNMDGSGSLVQALSNRPGTADSVLSETTTPRPHTSNTLILPRIQPGAGGDVSLGPSGPQKSTVAAGPGSPSYKECGMATIAEQEEEEQVPEEPGHAPVEEEQNTIHTVWLGDQEGEVDPTPPSRQPSPGPRTPLQPAKASNYFAPPSPPKSPGRSALRGIRGSPVYKYPSYSPTEGRTSPKVAVMDFTHSPPHTPMTPPSKTDSRCCSHGDRGGQELCYLCHQRTQKNVPVYFTEGRRRKELEQDRLLQQYQHQKDADAIFKEQCKSLENRQYNQKVAAFNLGVSEAIKDKVMARPTEFNRSYLFQARPLTPPRFIKQEDYSKELENQVKSKSTKLSRLKRGEEFLERLEQVQLAEDLALQREQYLTDKQMSSDLYRKALDSQIEVRKKLEEEVRSDSRPPLELLRLPKPQIIVPFSHSAILRLQGEPGRRTVRFKPLPIPALEPDSKGPIFGVHDATKEKLEDRRACSKKLYQEQLDMVAHKKREAILSDLKNQKEESDMLDRTRKDIILDRALRHQERLEARKALEDSWSTNAMRKRETEVLERRRARSPGMLIHEQCDKYRRCRQCGRRPGNCGESNVWSESRYIPGSRLMV